MKVDEAVSLATSAAMRGCDEGVNPDAWAEFADYVVDAAPAAARAVKAARDAAEDGAGQAEVRGLERRAFHATLSLAVAGLMTLAHLGFLERVDWPE